MPGIFSFNESAVKSIMSMVPSVVPGIEKIICVYYSPVTQALQSDILYLLDDDPAPEVLQISDSRAVMTRLRSESAGYTWLQKNDLPFDNPVKAKVQLDIFNELDHNILLIRIQNRFDYLNDLFFIYFNPASGTFGSVSPGKVFSPDNRSVIAQLLRNCILYTLDRMKEDRELFLTLKENQDNSLQEMANLKLENHRVKEKYKDGIIKLAARHLDDLSAKDKRRYVLTREAETRITEYPGPLPDLAGVLEKAAGFAALSAVDPMVPIPVEDHHIIFTEKQKPAKKKEEDLKDVPVRYSKTLLLLNKLENAARSVKARNEVLTSASIGNALPVRITPPAISDALKKHRSKIVHLLNEYPEKWEIIRNEFRPIRNILNVREENKQISA